MEQAEGFLKNSGNDDFCSTVIVIDGNESICKQSQNVIGSADMWHHMLFNKPITHLQSWRRASNLRQCSHIIYLILFVIPKVLNKKSSCIGLCLLLRTLCLQHILAFVHNRATPCFGCKYITVDSSKNYVISNCSLSPRLTRPPPDPVAEHTMVQIQIFAARGCIYYST